MLHTRPNIEAVAVFCGSRPGNHPGLKASATELGHGLARAGLRLVYGGGRIGLMGAVADAVLEAGGEVSGVIPEFLTQREVAHERANEMFVTDSMHTRKRRMFEMADAFVTMPGGLGTLDETVEIITWRQLGLHDKPILICDVLGWARGLLGAFEAAVHDGFADAAAHDLYEVVPDVPALLARLVTLKAAEHRVGEAARL
jgi:uncharacterized protein (TIGR00730 family)